DSRSGGRQAARVHVPHRQRPLHRGGGPRASRVRTYTSLRIGLKVSVWKGGAEGSFQEFDVPRHPSQTVLDVVTYIQRTLDPTLAYRFACRVGMCGSCAMTVNGVPRWTCRTHVDKVARNDKVEIGPLRNLPIIRDLVTDMREFFDKWARANGQFKSNRTRHDDFEAV